MRSCPWSRSPGGYTYQCSRDQAARAASLSSGPGTFDTAEVTAAESGTGKDTCDKKTSVASGYQKISAAASPSAPIVQRLPVWRERDDDVSGRNAQGVRRPQHLSRPVRVPQ